MHLNNALKIDFALSLTVAFVYTLVSSNYTSARYLGEMAWYFKLFDPILIDLDSILKPFRASARGTIHREYYTVARRYEFYVRVARTISHE